MAQGARSINIKITNETDGDRVPVSTPNEPQGTKSGAPVSVAKAERDQSKNALVAGFVVAQQVKPYVDQVIGFSVSQIQATTGSAELQQRAQVVSGAVSAIASIGMGAVVGGVPGAAISAALTVVSGAITTVQNGIAIETNRRIERESIDRKTSRLGQTINRSRTGGVT